MQTQSLYDFHKGDTVTVRSKTQGQQTGTVIGVFSHNLLLTSVNAGDILLFDVDDLISCDKGLSPVITSVVTEQRIPIEKPVPSRSVPAETTSVAEADLDKLLQKASQALTFRRYDQAEKLYRNCLTADRRNTPAIKGLLRCYQSKLNEASDESARRRLCAEAAEALWNYPLAETSDNLLFLETVLYPLRQYARYTDVADKLLKGNRVRLATDRFNGIVRKRISALWACDRRKDAQTELEEWLHDHPDDAIALRMFTRMGISESHATVQTTEKTVPSPNDLPAVTSKHSSAAAVEEKTPIEPPLIADNPQAEVSPETPFELPHWVELRLKALPPLPWRSSAEALHQQLDGRIKSLPVGTARAETRLSLLQLQLAQKKAAADYAADYLLDETQAGWDTRSPDSTRTIVRSAIDYLSRDFDAADSATLKNAELLFLLTFASEEDRRLSALKDKRGIFDRFLSQAFTGVINRRRRPESEELFAFLGNLAPKKLQQIFDDANLRNLSVTALQLYSADDPSLSEDFGFWQQTVCEARQLRHNNLHRLDALLSHPASTLEELRDALRFITSVKDTSTGYLDGQRLVQLRKIYEAVNSYIKTTFYSHKSLRQSQLLQDLSQLHNECMTAPTDLSDRVLLPLTTEVLKAVQADFSRFAAAAVPSFELTLTTDSVVKTNDNRAKVSFYLSLPETSAPVDDVSVTAAEHETAEFSQPQTDDDGALEGGNHRIYRMTLSGREGIPLPESLSLRLTVRGTCRAEPIQQTFSLRATLTEEKLFRRLENPYDISRPAEGKMLFGRDDLVDELVANILEHPGKQYILYGQKRSGKSSVWQAVRKKLNASGRAVCVSFSLSGLGADFSEQSFCQTILKKLHETLENLEFDGDIEVPSYTPVEILPNDNPFFILRRDLIKFKREAAKLPNWENRQLVLMIDEFTLCYSLIEEGKLAPEFLQQWKAFSQEGDTALSAVLIGQDVVPAFKAKDYARNAFGVIEDQRLTYLDTLSAAALITQPTADPLRNGASRFLGNSAQRLLRLTSRNPYFIQFACMKLVNWMNAHKLSVITEADIDDLTHDLLQGNNRVGLQNFDSLLRESEKDDGPYKEADELCVLRRIATLCGPDDYCRREDIAGCGIENWADIVQYLTNRDVLETGVADTVRIQVGLFQQWLTTN